jgi:hypothetical protein
MAFPVEDFLTMAYLTPLGVLSICTLGLVVAADADDIGKIQALEDATKLSL